VHKWAKFLMEDVRNDVLPCRIPLTSEIERSIEVLEALNRSESHDRSSHECPVLFGGGQFQNTGSTLPVSFQKIDDD